METALVWVTLAVVAIFVVALAAYLVIIAALLRQVRKAAEDILPAVGRIAAESELIGPILSEIRGDLDAIREALPATEDELEPRRVRPAQSAATRVRRR